METAKQFLSLFPEAQVWHISVLTAEKRAVAHKPSISITNFLRSLDIWMDMEGVHIFCRPLLNILVFLHLDAFGGSWQQFLQLQPRCVTQTSPGNFQFWSTLPPPMQVKTVPFVTKELQQLFQFDPHSTNPQQQGRLPSSMNVKAGKICRTTILHHSHDHLSEEVFLQLMPRRSLVWWVARWRMWNTNPPSAWWTEARRIGRLAVSGSKIHPDSSIDIALTNVNFLANRPNMNYYKETTLTKAREYVQKQRAVLCLSEAASCPEPSASSRPQ